MGIPGKDCEGTREILGEFGRSGAGHEHKKIKVSMVQCDVSIGRAESKWHGASTGKRRGMALCGTNQECCGVDDVVGQKRKKVKGTYHTGL